jgi:hypothetical protein
MGIPHDDVPWADIPVAYSVLVKKPNDLDHASNELPDQAFGYLNTFLCGIRLE